MFCKSGKSIIQRAMILAVFCACSRLSAMGSSDRYDSLMQDGSSTEITSALKADSDLITYTVGKDRNTLLMSALSYKRPLSIIKLLLSAGISPSAKNKYRQTAVSYACRYSDDPAVVSLVITSGAPSAFSRRRRLMARDKTGMYAAQYVFENSDAKIKDLVYGMLKPEDIALIEKAAGTETNTPAADMTAPAPAPAAPAPVPVPAAEAAPVPAPVPVPVPAPSSPSESKVPAPAEQPAPVQETPASAAGTPAPAAESTAPEKTVPAEPAVSVQPVPVTASAPAVSAVPAVPASSYEKTYLYDYAPSDDGSSDDTSSASSRYIPDANTADRNGVTPLMKALKDGNDWEADALLYSGANVNVKDNDGWTPLMYAVRYQNSEKLVSMLIGKGAEIRVSNTFGASPLILAAQYSENPAVLSHLLAAYSAGEESVSNALVFCLTGRASSERIRIAKVRLFIEKGVPVNRFYEGKTPLMYAAESCTSTDIISMLLDSGAIVSIRTADGKTAFDFAQANTRLPRDKVFWSLNTGKN